MTDDNNIFVLPVTGPGDALPSSMTYEIATLRDQFAMAALGSFCRCEIGAKEMAQLAYEIADAMMEARK